MIQFKPILRVIGVVLILIGMLMWSGVLMYWTTEVDEWRTLFLSGLITLVPGLALLTIKQDNSKGIGKREGYLIVTIGWIVMVLFGMIPYMIFNAIPNVSDAFFETVSGLTTTGATILTDIESFPKDLLYWRSLTQWLGGMGIVVLTVAIFPLLGIGGVELFVAEAPGPTNDKLHPRIRETAKRLWYIYVGLTVVLIPILHFEGMSWYDAINHALTTMPTGGFSTKNASIAAFESRLIEYTIILFMFIAGTNYTIIYFSLKGNFRRVWASDEFKFYAFIVVFLSLVVCLFIHPITGEPLEQNFRDSLFQVVAIITTTGYATADYTAWSTGVTFLFFLLLFSGASAGSTSGGIKLIRTYTFLKNAFLEFKRLLHPNAIIRVRINDHIVPGRVLTNIVIFLLVYISLFLLGMILLSFMGMDFETAAGASATAISNVGPAIGKLGPMDNFSWISDAAKWLLSFMMLLGRLELFTILILFSPYFWRVN